MTTTITPWKRTLWIVWFAEFTSIVGFSVITPILPLYIPQLGVSNPRAITFWSGAVLSVQAVTMALVSPIWGTLADRYGRKLMVERAMFGGAITLGLMGFVHTVEQLILLRALQGVLTGTIAAANTLVASTAPRERSGYAMGLLQMAIYLGASVGPVVGGLITDTLGFRTAFWITSGLLLSGGLLIAFLVKENFVPEPRAASARENLALLFTHSILIAMGIRLIVRTASQMTNPILPLFVEALAPAGQVATLSGLVRGANAATGAIGALALGRASDRLGHRAVLVTCAVVASLFYAGQFFANDVLMLTIWQAGSGLAMGGMLAALTANLARLAPAGRHGAVYGIDTTVASLANAIAPMIGSGLAMNWGLRAPFLASAAFFALGGVVIARLMNT